MSTAEKTRYTPQDLLEMPDGDRYELVGGHLVERHMGFWSSYVAGEIHWLLRDFCRAHPQGWVLPEGTSYRCFPDAPDLVRKPDVSFIRFDRLPADQAPQGHVPIHPDLAVEVLSPNDLVYEVEQKLEAYLRAGVRLIWVVNPDARTLRVVRADRSSILLREIDEVSGEDVLPGFHCRVSEFFRLPSKSGPAA